MSDVPAVPPSDPNATPASAPMPAPRRKRRWLRWLGVLVILFILLIALLPTLLSTAPARSIIIGQAQSFVPNGKLTVDDWSLGWFSPIRVEGLKLFDDKGELVAEANTIKTDLTLVKAIRQQFDLGETLIDADAAHVVVYPDGSSNLQKLFESEKTKKSGEKKPAPSLESKPARIPNARGDITLKLKGSVQMLDAAGQPVTTLALREGSGGTIKIADINTGIAPDLKFVYDTGDAANPSELALSGNVDAVKDNVVDLQDLAAKIDLSLKTVDLAAVQPLLAMAGQAKTQVAGIASGTIAGDLKPGQEGSITGEVTITNLKLQTPQIADVYQAPLARVPVKVTRSVAAGVSRLQVETRMILPEATVQLNGDLPESALGELGKKKIPTQAGTATLTLTADPEKLAAALPKTLRLQKGMTIDGGALSAIASCAIDPAKKAILSHVKADVSLNGTRDGQARSIPPVNVTADAALLRLDDVRAGLHDLVLSLSSGFANLKAAGPTIMSLQGNGDADLDKLTAQVSQFVDLGQLKLAGQATFALATKQNDNGIIHADVNADVNRLNVTLPQKAPIAMALAQLKLQADVRTDPETNGVKAIPSATLMALAGDSADKPLVDLQAKIDGYDVAAKTVKAINIDKCAISSLHEAQTRLIDPFISTLKDQHLSLTDGALYVVAKLGDVDLNSTAADVRQLDASLPSLRIERDGKEILRDTIRASLIGRATTVNGITAVDLSKLSLDSAIAKVTGSKIAAQLPDGKTPAMQLLRSAELSVTASLDRVAPLLQAIQSAPQPMPYRGTLNLTETVATAQDVLTLKGNGTIDQFQMIGAEGKVQFAEPKLALANDLSVDPAKEIATLKSVSLDMTASKAATLNITGGVSQWSSRRGLDNLVLKLDADGAKAWPLVYAMMSPQQQETYKDTVVKGPVTANFTLGGAYPAAQTWNESFRSMTGKGSLTAESISSMGLTLTQFALPLTIEKGQVITGDQSAAKRADRQVKPFTVNGGKADFSNIILNLGDPNLLLSIGKGQKLLQQVQINSVLAAQLGSLASIVFKDSKEASGLLDLTAVQCDNVRLADLMNKQANATFVYSITDLKVDGPVPSTLASLLDLGDQGFVGNIKDASLALKQGVAYQDMTVAVQKMVEQTNPNTGKSSKVATDQPIHFKGGVDLATNKFKDYSMTIANGLLLRDWRKSFPNGATVQLSGSVNDVASILGQSVGSLAVQGYGGNAIDKLLGGLEQGGKKKKKK